MKKIIALLLILACTSCNEKIKNELSVVNNQNEILKIKNQETSVIIDPVYTGIGDRKEIYQSNDSIYFFTLSDMQQKIEVINITSKKKKKEISFFTQEDFLKEQFKCDDFYIHNLDSIFLYSSSNSKLMLIDESGGVKNVWNLNAEIGNNQGDSFLHITTTGLPSIFYNKQNKQVLFRSYPPYNFDKDPAFYTKPFGIIYGLENTKLEKSFGNWPEHYKILDNFKPNNYILNYIPFFNKQIYYVSYRNDHNIYKYSLENDELLEVYDGKSNFLNDFPKVSKIEKSQPQIIVDYITTNGNYKKFLYQKDSKTFYRIVIHNQPLRDPKTQKMNNPTFNRDFSVIIFNENMIKIGEYKFDHPEDFTFFDLTPTPNGLLINYKDSEDENTNYFKIIEF